MPTCRHKLVVMSYEPADTGLKQLTDHWIAQWNEPSSDERRRPTRAGWQFFAVVQAVSVTLAPGP